MIWTEFQSSALNVRTALYSVTADIQMKLLEEFWGHESTKNKINK